MIGIHKLGLNLRNISTNGTLVSHLFVKKKFEKVLRKTSDERWDFFFPSYFSQGIVF